MIPLHVSINALIARAEHGLPVASGTDSICPGSGLPILGPCPSFGCGQIHLENLGQLAILLSLSVQGTYRLTHSDRSLTLTPA